MTGSPVLKLNKRTEYALIALRHIASRPEGDWVSVHEMSEEYSIPLELLAKVMQRLKRAGIVSSIQGFGGGYALSRDPTQVLLLEFLGLFDERVSLTDCCGDDDAYCARRARCAISPVLTALNARLARALRPLTLADILNLDGRTPLLWPSESPEADDA